MGAALRDVKGGDNGSRDVRERLDGWNDGLPPQVSSLSERYMCGVINLGCLRPFEEQSQYGFTISRIHETCGNGYPDLAQSQSAYMRHAGTDVGGEQPFVFPLDIELVASPNILVPSLVRLERFYDVPIGAGDAAYKFDALVISSRKIISTVSNGEVEVIRTQDHFATPDSACENVQTATDGVDVGPRLHAEKARKLAFWNRYHGIVRGWRWYISDEYINVQVQPEFDARAEGWEFGYGPLDRGECV